MSDDKTYRSVSAQVSLGLPCWLGGAVYVAHQPGYNFWDGLIWMYYVGRYIATHFVLLA